MTLELTIERRADHVFSQFVIPLCMKRDKQAAKRVKKGSARHVRKQSNTHKSRDLSSQVDISSVLLTGKRKSRYFLPRCGDVGQPFRLELRFPKQEVS
jgi:hypothetical protein